MRVEVELKHGEAEPWYTSKPISVVYAREVGESGWYTCGLTELDTLGSLRENKAFIMQVSVEDIELAVH